MREARSLLAGLLLSASLGTTALADPKFEFQKPPEKATDWSVQAKGGLLVTSGNSQSRNANLGLVGSRQAGDNKLSLEGNVAYGRSDIITPIIDNGMVVGLTRTPETTTHQWRTRGRYDRFLTANNAAYVLGQIGADRVAGKNIFL
jgi:hypothetical protein